MSKNTDIEIVFSDPEGAVRARMTAAGMFSIYFMNGRRFLPFDGMKLENLGGFLDYEGRSVSAEKVAELRTMHLAYRGEFLTRKSGGTLSAEAEKQLSHISRDGCRLLLAGAAVPHEKQITHRYFEDFFSMLCLIQAAAVPEITFEGRCCSGEGSRWESIRTRAVYDGKMLTFEQLVGEPMYDTQIVFWTRTDNAFVKRIRPFTCICVVFAKEDYLRVKQDGEIAGWVRGVNDTRKEMVSAELRFMCDSSSDVVIYAPSRDVCVRYRDALQAMLTDRGYRTWAASTLERYECSGLHAVIPDSVTSIGNTAFRHDASLQSVAIPESVTRIDSFAFEDCVSLRELVLPDSVALIGQFAFACCWSLRSAILSRNLEFLNSGLFCECGKLEEVVLPDGIRVIGSFAFSGCKSLKNLVLPGSMKKIESQAFGECTGLKSITIPESVTEIGEEIFRGCGPDLTVRGRKGSAAERYSAENGLTFAEIL